MDVREYAGGVLIRKHPPEEELAAAYKANADRAREINEEWNAASREANELL